MRILCFFCSIISFSASLAAVGFIWVRPSPEHDCMTLICKLLTLCLHAMCRRQRALLRCLVITVSLVLTTTWLIMRLMLYIHQYSMLLEACAAILNALVIL